MATRYTVTVVREEYIPASGHVTTRMRYETADYGLLQEAMEAVIKQADAWGWLVDDEPTEAA